MILVSLLKIVATVLPLPAGFIGRCQSHVSPLPRQKAKSGPGSCPRLPAVTTALHVTVVHHTIGRCQNHWRSHTPRDSSKSSLTHSTQSRGSPTWAPRVHLQALSARQLFTPWPSNRSPGTTALILVSSRFLKKRLRPLLIIPNVFWDCASGEAADEECACLC